MFEIKDKIKNSIIHFSEKTSKEHFFESVISLFSTLGYKTNRQARLEQTDFTEFDDFYVKDNTNFTDSNKKNKFYEKALTDYWESVDILFQITDQEMKTQIAMFDTGKFDNTAIYSYLFMGIILKKGHYTRTDLADITRQVNNLFSMPVVIVFKLDNKITICMIKRRINKKDGSKDVLEKVILIKDIDVTKPHRAHVEILCDLSLKGLQKENYSLNNFKDLQNAWEKVLDTKKLNNSFYKKIAAWYDWAEKIIVFPDKSSEAQQDYGKFKNLSLIRLLTRLIFVWFIKEKGLVSNKLFSKKSLKKILSNFDEPANYQKTIFYKAILQNLFFGALNTKPESRQYKALKNPEKYNFRYFDLIKDIRQWQKLFVDIPFLNGGLFENLDYYPDDNQEKELVLIDGFSESEKNELCVPDYLFFSENKIDTAGLINILNHYKFTISENTPIEEEIAIDPELLGKVFENLLARYNPETRVTARKETGSFYTPREIVDYMVDESIKISLGRKADFIYENIRAWLELILNYVEYLKNSIFEHPFNKDEAISIVKAISDLKIFDPACGSGAFPMGVLHKLVYILEKLDPDNSILRMIRKKESGFDDFDKKATTPDYARKLFLIENVIYGADIQPMAIQITKLRFFISLIVEQDKNNIVPLPNLETKFVIADTLIGIDEFDDKYNKNQPGLLLGSSRAKYEDELAVIRHNYFYESDNKKKKELRKRDKELREKIAFLFEKSGKKGKTAFLAEWNPYNRSSQARFYDTFWMFGLKKGFDIIIGNPPYVQIQKFSGKDVQKQWENERYDTFTKTGDIYTLFYERGNQLLCDGGILAFITSNKWMRAKYGQNTRKFFAEKTYPLILIDFGGNKIFENTTVDTNIFIFQKKDEKTIAIDDFKACTVKDDYKKIKYDKTKYTSKIEVYFNDNYIVMDNPTSDSWVILEKKEMAIKKQIEKVGKPLKEWDININYASKTEFNGACYDEFEKEKIVWIELVDDARFSYVESGVYCEAATFLMTGDSMKSLVCLLNSKLINWYFDKRFAKSGVGNNRWKKDYIENLPIPQLTTAQTAPFEALADLIIFAKENNLENESETLEAVVDNMVYDLYFEEEMKKSKCYITDRIKEVISPFKEDDTIEFKIKYLKKFYDFCKKDKTAVRCLLYNRTIETVKIINGALKNGG